MIPAQIFGDETRVHASKATPDDAVAFGASQSHQGFETRTEIISSVPDTRWLIRYDKRKRWTQRAIVLDHHDARRCDLDRLPNPVVIKVDIDAEYIYVPNKFCLRKQRIYVLCGNQLLEQSQPSVFEKLLKMRADLGHGSRAGLEPQSAPALDQQLGGVALETLFNAKFHQSAIPIAAPPE